MSGWPSVFGPTLGDLWAPPTHNVSTERVPRMTKTRSERATKTSPIEKAVMFCIWAHGLRRFPCAADIATRFEVSRATAYRLRELLARGYGIEPPTDTSEDDSVPHVRRRRRAPSQRLREKSA